MFVDCLILGDSIAVGVGQDRPACTTVARVGISSAAFVHTLLPSAPRQARSAVISLGVNDGPAGGTADALRQMRRSIQAAHVTWLLPAPKEAVRAAIRAVAAEFRDRLVDTSGEVGPDRLHPTGAGYRHLAALTAQDAGPQIAAGPPPGVFHPFNMGVPGMPRVIYLIPPLRGGPVALNWPPTFLGRPAPFPPH